MPLLVAIFALAYISFHIATGGFTIWLVAFYVFVALLAFAIQLEYELAVGIFS